jgi:hypothetical protein
MIAEIMGNHWAAHPLDAVRLMKHNPDIIQQQKKPWEVYESLASIEFF